MGIPFKFVPPPEAPVFCPSEEEFKDPIGYFMKIRHIGIKTGICKIIPPKSWNPPFAVNMGEFKFTPRIQRLYELEAHSRMKLNFLGKLYNYIRTQGGDKIRVPSISGRFLDLYALYTTVRQLGGYDKICKEHLWSTVAEKIGYQSRQAPTIKTNYEKLILSFAQLIDASILSPKESGQIFDRGKRARPSAPNDETNIDYSVNKELRNLQFFGAGPKAAVPVANQADSSTGKNVPVEDYTCRFCRGGDNEQNLLVCSTKSCQACYHIYCLTPPLKVVPKYQWVCPECVRSICLKAPEPYGFPQSSKSYSLHEFGVMADNFKRSYFKKECTDVPCSVVEREFWRILQEYNDDVVVEYGADVHSSAQGSGFPTVSCLKNMEGSAEQLIEAKQYATHPWNLNIMPLLDRSVLRFIKGNIDGMKIPWCYVGMVFSSFCWHIEDHWSYSINFNHFGEPKTWYGVSRLYADQFETAMRKHASELFDQSPDLLHHITTNMNPNLLQAEGVPIYRTDQYCGEFVITFPRAYHAGFNQGFNFAEAVNICLPDWLPVGRACVDHYAEIRRHCVFSNDELLCTLAEVAVGRCKPEDVLILSNPPVSEKLESCAFALLSSEDKKSKLPAGCSTAPLDMDAVVAVHEEFVILLSQERQYRKSIQEYGVIKEKKIRFDELPDDLRVCDVCLTTLFLSAVSCNCADDDRLNPTKPAPEVKCTMGRKRTADVAEQCPPATEVDGEEQVRRYVVCPRHISHLCNRCSPRTWTLKYHFTLMELDQLEKSLAGRLGNFYNWRDQLTRCLSSACLKQSRYESERTSVEIKPDPADPASGDYKRADDTRMTIAELKCTLDNGFVAGYQLDPVYAEAEQVLKTATNLVDVCTRLQSLLCADQLTPSNGSNELNSNMAHFTVKLPVSLVCTESKRQTDSEPVAKQPSEQFANLQHQINLTNPRELDLSRLLDACKQCPVNLCFETPVQFVERLISRVSSWRQTSRVAINSVCRLNMANATRSFSLTYSNPPCFVTTNGENTESTNDEQISNLLTPLLDDLRCEFPNYVHRIPEWNLLNLLCRAAKWLSTLQKQQDDSTEFWTFTQLRYHLSSGEDILAQLNTVSNLKGSRSPNKAAARPPQPAYVAPHVFDTATTQAARLVRGRMHTNLGTLSQVIVQVDSLVSILYESFIQPDSSPFGEMQLILDQLSQLRVKHLVDWPGATDTFQRPTDFPAFCVDQAQEDLFEPLTLGVAQLRDAFAQHTCTFLDRVKLHRNDPIEQRLWNIETETLRRLGTMLDSSSSGSSPMDEIGSSTNISPLLKQLDSLLSETQISLKEIGTELLNSSDSLCFLTSNEALIKYLLPKLSTPAANAGAYQTFRDSCLRSAEDALTAFREFAEVSKRSVLDLLKTIESSIICPSCMELFNISSKDSSAVLPPPSECTFCSFKSKPSSNICLPASLEEIETRLLSGDHTGSIQTPLYTPVHLQLQGQCELTRNWLNDVAKIVKITWERLSHRTSQLGDICFESLPDCVRRAIQYGSTTSIDASILLQPTDQLTSELRLQIAIGSSLPLSGVPTVSLLNRLLSLYSPCP